MKKDKLDVIGFVDGQLVEKADKYTGSGKKNARVRWGAIAACLCLVVAGAFGLSRYSGNTIQVPDNDGESVSVPSDLPGGGIHIPAIVLPDPTDGVKYDMIGLIVYNGGVYTQAEYYYGADALTIDSLIGNRLGYATGSINEWSTQDEYAEEFASTNSGEVYSVIGYDTDFRICIRHEASGENELFIGFFERLNGITLATGEDLFEARLHLRDRITGIQWQSHSDWNNNGGNIQDAVLDPALWEEFLNQLYSGDFVCAQSEDNSLSDQASANTSIYEKDRQAHIILTMEDGTVVRLLLIEGGYVGYEALGCYFVKIPGDAFDCVFSACGGDN